MSLSEFVNFTLSRQTVKPRIVFFGHLPPPIHGVAMVNSWIQGSTVIHSHFDIRFVNISFSDDLRDIGKSSFKKIGRIMSLGTRIIRTLVKEKPTLVIFNCSPLGFAFYRDVTFSILIRLFSKRPIVFYVHGKGFADQSETSIIYRRLSKIMFNKNYVIGLSDSLQKDMRHNAIIHYYSLNNGLPAASVLPLDNSSRPVTFLFLSNFIRSKGILDFVEALIRLKKNSPLPFRFVLLGNEYDVTKQALLDKIQSGGIAGELLNISSAYDIEKEKWLAERCDVLVLPSHNDAYPLVILEAFRAGLPVISTIQGAIPEIVKEEYSGYLLPSGDIIGIVDRMERFLSQPDLLRQMKVHAKQEFELRFTLSIFENHFIEIIDDILKRNGDS